MTPRSLIIAVAILLVASLGMGGFVWHIRRTVASEAPVEDGQPVAPPISGPSEQVTLYIAFDSPAFCCPRPPTFLCHRIASNAPGNYCARSSATTSISLPPTRSRQVRTFARSI